jgi:hypothetical protein
VVLTEKLLLPYQVGITLCAYMEAADLMRDTHRRSQHLSAESYPHTIRAGRLDARSSLLHLLLPMACKGGRAVRCADRILCLSSPPEFGSQIGAAAEGTFSVLGRRNLVADVLIISYRRRQP